MDLKFNPTEDQTFELEGKGRYNCVRHKESVDALVAEGRYAEACEARYEAFQTLMAAGLHPELAAEKSGISSDPVKDMKMSEKWLEMIWGNPEKVVKAEQTDGGQGEAKIEESDSFNGENETGGAV